MKSIQKKIWMQKDVIFIVLTCSDCRIANRGEWIQVGMQVCLDEQVGIQHEGRIHQQKMKLLNVFLYSNTSSCDCYVIQDLLY